MDGAKLRAWWSHRQGLDGSLDGVAPAEVLARTGWARSVGGAGPYLTLFARAGTGREEADRAAAELLIHELPSARGCTYVVPALHFALALKLGRESSEAAMKQARKLGVTDEEIGRLGEAVVQALEGGALDPDGIRRAVGDAARNLGEEGKKKGLTTTLPLALGVLQAAGEIRRVPTNGRLDQQRYRYTVWRPNPLAGFSASDDEARTELARLFFRWVGPATPAEFQWFSGLGVKAARAALGPLGLVAVDGERLMFENDLEEFKRFRPPAKPRYTLVSSLDGIQGLRRDVRGLLDEVDVDRPVFAERSMLPAGGLTDLPSHAIFDRGRLVGLWEYDPDSHSIAWSTFGVKDDALVAAVQRTEAFVREQLGDARSFSLDSPKSRAPRIAALRAA